MSDHCQPDGINLKIWDTFTSDPATGVTLMTPEGQIVYINEQSIRIFFDEPRTVEELTGKWLHELGFPAEWIDERVKLMTEIVGSGQRRLLRTVWNGKQQFSWISPIKGDEEDQRDLALVITRRVPTTNEELYLMDEETEVIQSGVINLGTLSVLTPRELEILALLGQGMSIKEIAGMLFRSVKTIENHRESIGRKLKRTRGVELAGIAQSAGLMMEDSKRMRVENADHEGERDG